MPGFCICILINSFTCCFQVHDGHIWLFTSEIMMTTVCTTYVHFSRIRWNTNACNAKAEKLCRRVNMQDIIIRHPFTTGCATSLFVIWHLSLLLNQSERWAEGCDLEHMTNVSSEACFFYRRMSSISMFLFPHYNQPWAQYGKQWLIQQTCCTSTPRQQQENLVGMYSTFPARDWWITPL